MTNKMVERITKSFESQSMMKTLGARIHKVEKGKVIIEALYFLLHFNSRAMAMQD